MVESRAQADAINSRMNRKDYEKELCKLQIGLCRLQDWVKHKGGCGSSSCSKDVMLLAKAVPGCSAAEPVRSRKVPDVHAALYPAFSGGR